MNKPNRRNLLRTGGLAFLGAGALSGLEPAAFAQRGGAKPQAAPTPDPAACNCTHASDGSPLDIGTSEVRPLIERYVVELRDLGRVYPLQGSPVRLATLEKFYANQLRLLEGVAFDGLSQPGKVDYLLLRERLLSEQKRLAADARQDAAVALLIPFQRTIMDLEEARRRMETVGPQKSAMTLAKLTADLAAAHNSPAVSTADPAVLNRAAVRLSQLRNVLRTWFDFYNLYDPKFAWWVDGEYKKADEALDAHAQFLHTKSGISTPLDSGAGTGGRGGGGGREAVNAEGSGAGRGERRETPHGGALGSNQELSGVGPAGNDALVEALRAAMVAYTPDELIAIANREFAWCDREMLRASNEMGFGNDWKKALDAVKNRYVEPGQMIYLVRDLSREAIEYLEKRELVTIPPLVKEDYWEEAITPKMQLVSPFFLGGETIQVSSPASSMTLQERLESMRGNNMFFARATVFHELVPGHHMQRYMTQRYRTYRTVFSTPFWTEGMAFYWEMLLWDLGFTHTPEQRVGALFWRMHRCARIIFSLSFHVKKMTAVECVQFLVDRVGFERANAEGEVRRSFNGSYPPIYQCAYMLGALQFYALHKELVGSGKMTNRAFHDALYREGNIPVEMTRLALNGQKVTRDYETSWKFYGPLA
jgi:hypothetical protein